MRDDEPIKLVARYLLENGHLDTLHAFLAEAGVSLAELRLEEVAVDHDGEPITLETILEQRRLSQLAASTTAAAAAAGEERASTGAEHDTPLYQAWNERTAPKVGHELKLAGTPSNVLAVAVIRQHVGAGEGKVQHTWIAVATADSCVRLYDLTTLELVHDCGKLHTAPVLDIAPSEDGSWMATASMDGTVKLTDLRPDNVGAPLAGLQKHARYANRIAVHEDRYLATSGFDNVVHLYSLSHASQPVEAAHVGSMTLPSRPESLLFIPHAEAGEAVSLCVARRETNMLEHYTLPALAISGRQNLNANGDMWVSFSAADITLSPQCGGAKGRQMLGVSASTSPNGRFLLLDAALPTDVRDSAPPGDSSASFAAATTASAADAAAAAANGRADDAESQRLLDRFAHLASSSSSSPHTTSRTSGGGRGRLEGASSGRVLQTIRHAATQSALGVPPRHCWRPAGDGVWCNSDDGLIYGLSLAPKHADDSPSSNTTQSITAGGRGIAAGGRLRSININTAGNGGEVQLGYTATVLGGGGGARVRHENAIRSLWAGVVSYPASSSDAGTARGQAEADGGGGWRDEEVLVSGGFDKKVIVWRAT